MKKLTQFMHFDFEAFSKGKIYQTVGISEWVDYSTKEHMGTKVEVVIVKDDTQYKQKEGETVSNRFEKLTFKISKDVKVPVGAYVRPVNAVATVYGEYRNQLSVTADDIQVLTPNKQRKEVSLWCTTKREVVICPPPHGFLRRGDFSSAIQSFSTL